MSSAIRATTFLFIHSLVLNPLSYGRVSKKRRSLTPSQTIAQERPFSDFLHFGDYQESFACCMG